MVEAEPARPIETDAAGALADLAGPQAVQLLANASARIGIGARMLQQLLQQRDFLFEVPVFQSRHTQQIPQLVAIEGYSTTPLPNP